MATSTQDNVDYDAGIGFISWKYEIYNLIMVPSPASSTNQSMPIQSATNQDSAFWSREIIRSMRSLDSSHVRENSIPREPIKPNVWHGSTGLQDVSFPVIACFDWVAWEPSGWYRVIMGTCVWYRVSMDTCG